MPEGFSNGSNLAGATTWLFADGAATAMAREGSSRLKIGRMASSTGPSAIFFLT